MGGLHTETCHGLQMTPDVLLYANVARGFVSGGFNTGNFNPVNTFNPSYVWNYEAGVKTRMLEGRLTAAASAFHSNYTDLQQLLFGANFIPIVENASGAKIGGFELELRAIPADRWSVGGSLTVLDSRFTDLMSADPVYPELGVRNLNGNRLPQAPRLQANFSVERKTIIGAGWTLTPHLNAHWQSSEYFDFFNHPRARQGSYAIFSANIRIDDPTGKWALEFYGRNIFDKRYFVNESTATFFTPTNVVDIGTPVIWGGASKVIALSCWKNRRRIDSNPVWTVRSPRSTVRVALRANRSSSRRRRPRPYQLRPAG